MLLTHTCTESPSAGLGGLWDPRDTNHGLEELAHLSNELSPSPVSVPDHSANPFHLSGDMDLFLLRDQERNKSLSVSIQDQLLSPALSLLTQQQPDFSRTLSLGHSLTLE